MKQTETAYKELLSTDYELLYSLVKAKHFIICFVDVRESISKYRNMTVCKSPQEFDSLYLAYIDSDNDEENKRLYIEHCRTYNLTFINPNMK